MIEPYRPIVDVCVKNILRQYQNETTLIKEIRADLVGISLAECIIEGEKHVLHNAVEKTCSSLVSAFREKKAELLAIPELII